MHAQTESTQAKPERGRRQRRYRDPIPEERLALRLLSEQAAVPLDQLARFLGGSLGDSVALVQGLEAAGCIEHRRFLVRDYPWFWLSHRGARLAGTGFHYKKPDVAFLAHRRAINEVRLHLAERASQGRWICERTVYRQRDPEEHLPDAVFEIDGERHAIEAELSIKHNDEIRRIVAEHSNRYEAVLYFCGPGPYRLLKRVQAEGRWPKLIVRRVPQGEPC
ncbi:MAG: hypothetical protein WB507_09995 [Solirubrobacterales bacterium]